MSMLRLLPAVALALGTLAGCAEPQEPAAPSADRSGDFVDAPDTGKADDTSAARTPFQVACDQAAEDVDACLADNPAASCLPQDESLALSCCNAFGSDALATCGQACEADAVSMPTDLSFLEAHFGQALVHAETYVVPTCGGVSFESVVASHRDASEGLAAHGVASWGDGESVDALDGMLLQSVDGILPALNELGRDDRIDAWSFGVEVLTDEAIHHFSKWVLFFPRTGVVVVLEGEVAFI